jgi:hypothetical protein
MKITLKCEQSNYDVFTGKEGSIERTVTHEFVAPSLGDALENYEMFLRGIGFHFDGQLDIVTDEVVEDTIEYQGVDVDEQMSSQVINQMVDSLLNNAKISTIDQAQDSEHCSRCGLSKTLMQQHVCWDNICPVHGRG